LQAVELPTNDVQDPESRAMAANSCWFHSQEDLDTPTCDNCPLQPCPSTYTAAAAAAIPPIQNTWSVQNFTASTT
jgi:hypothetical protein